MNRASILSFKTIRVRGNGAVRFGEVVARPRGCCQEGLHTPCTLVAILINQAATALVATLFRDANVASNEGQLSTSPGEDGQCLSICTFFSVTKMSRPEMVGSKPSTLPAWILCSTISIRVNTPS